MPCRSNARLTAFLCLSGPGSDRSASLHHAAETATPKGGHAFHQMVAAAILEPDVGEAGFARAVAEIVPIAEALRGVHTSGGMSARGCKADLRDSLAEKALDALLAKI